MTEWEELTPGREPARRSSVWLPVLAPFGAAAVLYGLGAHGAGAVVFGVGALLALARAIRPSIAAAVAGGLASFGRGVGHVLTVVLLGVVEVVVFLPLSLAARALRFDPLVERGTGAAGRWRPRPDVGRPAPQRLFATEVVPPSRGLRIGYLLVRVVGWVVIVAILNYGLGWMWDELLGTHDMPVAAPVSVSAARELADAPAMAGAPWAQDYWQEVRRLAYEFHPFILSRVEPTDGRYIHVDGPLRRSYVPLRLLADAPEVWFFGGAALWGEGQRDDHTIPSEVARLADADGTPLRALNFGQPGYTSWQDAMLLEQELAVRPAPALVVFYDGADDVAVQLEDPSRNPTHYDVRGVNEALNGPDSAREQAQDWWARYRHTSVVHRLMQRVQGLVGVQAAGADVAGIADRVADLHARSVDLATFAASEHHVPTLFTWQAAQGVLGDDGAYRTVASRPGQGIDGAVDLSGALDGEAAVFLDGVLTNERGAHVVGEQLWALVRARLAEARGD